jgi:hypothetical protein
MVYFWLTAPDGTASFRQMTPRTYSAIQLTRQFLLPRKTRAREITANSRPAPRSGLPHAIRAIKSNDKAPSLFDPLLTLSFMKDDELREKAEEIAQKVMRFLEDFEGRIVDSPKGAFTSPLGALRITAKPHITIETETRFMHFVFWNSKSQDLYAYPAEMLAAMFIHAIPAGDRKGHTFCITNLNTENSYLHAVVSTKVAAELGCFISDMEKMVIEDDERKKASPGNPDFLGYPSADELRREKLSLL